MDITITIRDQALLTCRRLLSQLNRDPATLTFGCFDRRYWAWKLTDFPEATYQRNVAPLCWYFKQPECDNSPVLIDTIKSALAFTFRIQHKNGAFDQAYPYEKSYGATAFLLPDLITAFEEIRETLSTEEMSFFKMRLQTSADFLCKSSEQHGFVSNHLAGAALGLQKAYQLLGDDVYARKSNEIIQQIIDRQSDEGWFAEYGGADPGYQTLCMYYLAQIFALKPSQALRDALDKSLDFLQFFIHPDGTFGGEYGSRRTEVYYPGGIALLSKEFPIAAAMTASMMESIKVGKTATLIDIDLGNTAPLLSNYILTLQQEIPENSINKLPKDKVSIHQYFEKAGLGILSNKKYFAIYGISNGGVLKIFKKRNSKLVFDDCGLLGTTARGKQFTSQITNLNNKVVREDNVIEAQSQLGFVSSNIPNPFNYLLLRLANLTFMRVPFLNEWIKRLLVKTLVRKGDMLPISRTRRIEFAEDTVSITDVIEKKSSAKIAYLSQGIKFSAIHMASARYFSPSQLERIPPISIDCDEINRTGTVTQSLQIDIDKEEVVFLV